MSADQALAIGAALERGSTHPLAQAFQRHADVAVHAIALDEVRGEGMEGYVAGVRYRLGRPEYVAKLSGERPAEAQLVLGDASGVIATFAVADAIRATALEAVRALRALGLELVIASGDHHDAVEAIAAQLGIEHAHSRLTPERKIQLVEDLRARGKHVLMLGDGINDGPVLAAADVSCAMGHGSAVAQAAADLLLIDDSLRGIARAVVTARRTRAIMRQNLTWAFVYNIAAVPLAAVGLIAPWLAALGMSFSSLAVVMNARRLTRS
jgi:Cu2+-exporting ATPase